MDVYGIDFKGFNYDEKQSFNQKFVEEHQQAYESVFSICALHFQPLTSLQQVVRDFHSVIAPGGRGYLSLNLARMLEFEGDFKKWSQEDVAQFVKQELDQTEIKFLVRDHIPVFDEWLDGNLRLVMEK